MHPLRPFSAPTARRIALLACALGLACAAPGGPVPSHADVVVGDPHACAARAPEADEAGLVATLPDAPIRLLSWNVQKHARGELDAEISRLAEHADLLLLQEATRDHEGAWPAHGYFAPGYRAPSGETGVFTASAVAPVARCRLQHVEPWLRTPKATNVTRYALTGRDDTLLVLNLHVVNFTFGVEAVRRQLASVHALVAAHEGPVIVSGDFNTWSALRERTVGEVFDALGLRSIDYGSDRRTRILGRAVDHVFVRGLEAGPGASAVVATSDHNPVWVELRLQDPAGVRASERRGAGRRISRGP